jgi:hypothetical protein
MTNSYLPPVVDIIRTGDAVRAETARTGAETARTGAETARTGAETARTGAETARTAAETARDNAQAASASAAASYDAFDDRYLGAKASDPALDNDGAPLITGALYWSTTLNNLRFWSGSTWVPTNSTFTQSVADTRYLQLTGGTLTGGLNGTTGTYTGLLRSISADGVTGLLANGASKGVRFVPSNFGFTIEGVDHTGVGSYQPLTIGGSTVTLGTSGTTAMSITGTSTAFSGGITGTTAAFSGAVSGTTGGFSVGVSTPNINTSGATNSVGVQRRDNAAISSLFYSSSGSTRLYTSGVGTVNDDLLRLADDGSAQTLNVSGTFRQIWHAGNFDPSTKANTSALANYLPLTGATLTGQLTISYAGPVVALISTWGTRSLHAAGGLIGFLSSGGGWTSYTDNVGNFTAIGNVTAFSDPRLKTDLAQISGALQKVSLLTGYTYERIDTGERQVGLLSTDVEAAVPEAVQKGGEYDAVNYGGLVGLLVEAIKELTARVEQLEANR